MKLQTFNGGEHSKPRPQFIQLTEGVEYVNIDTDKGSLCPVMLPKPSPLKLGKYSTYYFAGDTWIDSSVLRYYVEFQKNLYWCDGTTAAKKLNSKLEERLLGIAAPASAPKVTGVKNPEPVSDVKIEPLSDKELGLPMEDHIYLLVNHGINGYSPAFQFTVTTRDKVVTVLQETTDPRIMPKVNSTVGDDAKRQVKVSGIKGVEVGEHGFKLFRQYAGKYYLVGTFTDSITDTKEDISDNGELNYDLFGPLKGVYQYVVTYYNKDDGAESAPSPITDEYNLDSSGHIVLTNLPVSADPQVTHKKLYRVGGYLAEFTLVKELTKGETDFVDSIGDTKVHGDLLSTSSAYPPPTDIQYLTEAYAMLFAAQGPKLRFTPIGKPDEWPESFYLLFDADITGIAPVSNGILVFTKLKTFIVTGTGPTTLSQYLLSSDQGCKTHLSICRTGAEAVWVSADGICISSGGAPLTITKDKLGKIDLDPIDSAVYDGRYYVLDRAGSVLCYDHGIISRYSFDTERLLNTAGKFYGWHDGRFIELFKSDLPAYWKFKSACFTEGAFTRHKTYKKLFIYYTGHVIITILINNIVVQRKELDGIGSETIQIPQEQQRGFFLQLELEGTGEVSEIEWTVGNQNE